VVRIRFFFGGADSLPAEDAASASSSTSRNLCSSDVSNSKFSIALEDYEHLDAASAAGGGVARTVFAAICEVAVLFGRALTNRRVAGLNRFRSHLCTKIVTHIIHGWFV
jgi:hypothetical protein